MESLTIYRIIVLKYKLNKRAKAGFNIIKIIYLLFYSYNLDLNSAFFDADFYLIVEDYRIFIAAKLINLLVIEVKLLLLFLYI